MKQTIKNYLHIGLVAISLSALLIIECQAFEIDQSKLHAIAKSANQSYVVAEDLYIKFRHLPEYEPRIIDEFGRYGIEKFIESILTIYSFDGLDEKQALVANQKLMRHLLTGSCSTATELAIVAPTLGLERYFESDCDHKQFSN